MERLIVIDTDAGVDDALAIFMALGASKNTNFYIKLLAITCVSGNTHVDNVCVNVTRTLECFGAKIPIYRGSETAMVVPYSRSPTTYHGKDGFGGADLPEQGAVIEDQNAVLALIQLSKEYPGRIDILGLGPLTNIAMAVRLDSGFSDRVNRICVMGGNIEPVKIPTFNFRGDPEAAFVVLSSFSSRIIIVPYEACKRRNLKEFRLNILARVKSPQAELLNKIEVENIAKDLYSPCDPIAAAVLLEQKVIQNAKELNVSVELGGESTRGLMLIDPDDPQKNATVVYEINYDLYLQMLHLSFEQFRE